MWLRSGWNDNYGCNIANSGYCPDINQTGGLSDNIVVIIDGDLELKKIDHVAGVMLVVLGNLTVEDVNLNANLAVMGNLTVRGKEGLKLYPKMW